MTERQVREKQLVLHPSPSIPKTQKYVSPAAASWPGGRGVALILRFRVREIGKREEGRG